MLRAEWLGQAGDRWLQDEMGQPKLETMAQRLVYGEDGTRWRVREARAHDVPGAQSSSCLIFDAGNVCRRVWSYPEQWTALPDASLLEVMERLRRSV